MLLILIILFLFVAFLLSMYLFKMLIAQLESILGQLLLFFCFMCHLNRNDLTSIINNLVY